MKGFIFGGDTKETPDSLKRKRAVADALLAKSRAPRNVGEGLSELGNAIAYRRMSGQIDKGAAYGQEQAKSGMAPIIAAIGGGRSQGAPEPSFTPQASASGASFDGDLKSGISSTAESLGVDPVDLATAISYETAGTFDPTKKGPTTQWGQHRGLIQFGEPQAKKYGVDWNNPVGSQLGPDGAVAKYLRDTGVKPGMGMMDIYSAINAGGVGLSHRSDANNGGAPGTVADKVNNQMAGHRAKALAMFGNQPVQTASLDPSSGLGAIEQVAPQRQGLSYAKGLDTDPALAYEPTPQTAQQPAQPDQPPQTMDPLGSIANPVLAGQNAGPFPDAPQPQQVAQAQRQGQGGIALPQLLEAAQNPWVAQNPLYGQILNTLIEDQLSMNKPMDPMQKAQLEKLVLENEQLRNPRMSPEAAARLEFDKQKFEADQSAPQVVGGNSRLATPDGRVLLDAVPETPNLPSSVQEYQFYVEQARAAGKEPLGPLEYEQALKEAGKPVTNFNVNNGDHSPLPGLSKLGEGMTYVYGDDGLPKRDERGAPIAVPIPGTDRAKDAQKAIEQAKLSKEAKEKSANIVMDEISLAKELIETSNMPTTGIAGGLLANIDSTDAGKVKNRLMTIKGNLGFDKLQAMRDASPTGGALGQVSEFENRLLQSVFGSLEQSQSKEDLLYNLTRLQDLYGRVINEGIPDEEAKEIYRNMVLGKNPSKNDDAPPGIDQELYDMMTPEERALWK